MIKRNKKRLVGIEKKKYLHGGRLFSSILRLMTKSVSSSTEIKDSTEDDLERFFREIERVGENLGGRRLTFNESLRCDIEQDKLQNQPYTVFVTSSNSKFIQLRQRSEFSHSLWQNRIPYPLWMYHENTWEIAYGRNPLKKGQEKEH
eukprot:jgi/Bigna1/131274/aug1.13_g5982